jgi:hypothetical protein
MNCERIALSKRFKATWYGPSCSPSYTNSIFPVIDGTMPDRSLIHTCVCFSLFVLFFVQHCYTHFHMLKWKPCTHTAFLINIFIAACLKRIPAQLNALQITYMHFYFLLSRTALPVLLFRAMFQCFSDSVLSIWL